MPDTPGRAMAEAAEWLDGARRTMEKIRSTPRCNENGMEEGRRANGGEGASNVCCAQAIHSIIRANDALCMKFMKHKPTRHEDAPRLLGKMVDQGKIKPVGRKFEHMLAKAMAGKSGADYGKADFKWGDAEFFVKKAEEFLVMARKYVEV